MSPQQLLEYQNALSSVNTSNDPEAALANRATLNRITGRLQGLSRGDAGNGMPMMGGMGMGTGGVPGAAGGTGGFSTKDLITLHGQQQKAGVDAARLGIEKDNADRAAAAQKQQAFKDYEDQYTRNGTMDPSGNLASRQLFGSMPEPGASDAEWKTYLASDKGKFAQQALDAQISQSDGANSGASLGTLRFGNDPNNFTVGTPNSLLPDDEARKPWYNVSGWAGRNRFPNPYYNTANVSKLRRLSTLVAPLEAENE